MAKLLTGITNFLQFINNNWTAIIIVIGLILAIYKKIVNYLNLSTEQKIDLAKEQIKEVILSLVSEAELEWEDYKKSGDIKRSQVIAQIYELYPILNRAIDQSNVIEWIDNLIDSALADMHLIFENNLTIE